MGSHESATSPPRQRVCRASERPTRSRLAAHLHDRWSDRCRFIGCCVSFIDDITGWCFKEVGPWVQAGDLATQAKHDHVTFLVDEISTVRVAPGESWLYLGPGVAIENGRSVENRRLNLLWCSQVETCRHGKPRRIGRQHEVALAGSPQPISCSCLVVIEARPQIRAFRPNSVVSVRTVQPLAAQGTSTAQQPRWCSRERRWGLRW